MRVIYYSYNNHIEIEFRNVESDYDVIAIIQEALMGVAKEALDKNNAEKAIEALATVRDLSGAVVKMSNWTPEEEKDE